MTWINIWSSVTRIHIQSQLTGLWSVADAVGAILKSLRCRILARSTLIYDDSITHHRMLCLLSSRCAILEKSEWRSVRFSTETSLDFYDIYKLFIIYLLCWWSRHLKLKLCCHIWRHTTSFCITRSSSMTWWLASRLFSTKHVGCRRILSWWHLYWRDSWSREWNIHWG